MTFETAETDASSGMAAAAVAAFARAEAIGLWEKDFTALIEVFRESEAKHATGPR